MIPKKNFFKHFFGFIGGVHFAVTLIGVTALFVIAGTLIESLTESHRYAAFYTYRHPAFIALLILFFLNILLAALRRWPFKWHHIPFLLTHLGLLMIIGGTLIKQIYGIQGVMKIMEGSGSHEIALPETHALRIQKRDPADENKKIINDYDLFSLSHDSFFPEIGIELIGYTPHVSEELETWIKGPFGVITGLTPFQTFSWQDSSSPVPLSAKVRFFPEPDLPWNVYAIQVTDREKCEKELIKALKRNLATGSFCVVKDLNGIGLIAINPSGEIWKNTYDPKNLETFIVYDEGFGGYAAFASITFPGEQKKFTLETPITLKHNKVAPLKKMENNLPAALLRLKKGSLEEILSLSYDPQGLKLAWPALKGEYLLRYQSKVVKIPHHVRLRQARQINYPGSNQPYSFESDLLITDLRTGTLTESTISMNQVHETSDGYRFYLSNITPADESDVKRIQLIVNYDPVKYYLTYPGGAVLSLGICLLFWLRPYRKKRSP